MWIFLSLMSAIATGAVAVISKAGLKNVDSSLGFAVQSVAILIATWSYVILTGKTRELSSIEPRAWGFLLVTGVVSAVAYLFYFGAVKAGDVSRVAPLDRLSLVFAILFAALFLSEKITMPVVVGGALMVVGALVIAVFGAGGK